MTFHYGYLVLLTAYKTSIFEDFLLLLLFTPEICESVDDDTKDEIEHNNDDNEEEQKVIHNPCNKQRFLKQRLI